MKNVVSWFIAVLLAVLFALVGALKLLGVPGAVKEFDLIGFGQWFRYLTGILEVTGAVGLVLPRFRLQGALLIACIMAGATMINLWILRVPGLARVTAVLIAMALVLVWLHHSPKKEV